MTSRELEAAISFWDIWGERATLLLAVGIFGEYVLPLLLGEEKDKPLWRKVVGVMFAVLVVVGIGGEYVASSHVSSAAPCLWYWVNITDP